ncbi:hypothetical protein Golomagni_01464 [Golovinomyces magnicellulatus]|nr:hypothetical protein Golomagni_01464 [Golovinomyces magnicellulatus]
MSCVDNFAADSDYNHHVESFRDKEYPMLKDVKYLDHAGMTLYSKSFMENFMSDMLSNLYGNPHSASASSQLSSARIENIRVTVLKFFKADPEFFDIVFVANATAGIKLVTEAFQSQEGSFNYAYHLDSHTSLIGVRESAQNSYCWDDSDVEFWLSTSHDVQGANRLSLFAYPAQSNMNGRRLPLSWSHQIRLLGQNCTFKTKTLLDASSLVSTAQLNLSNYVTAPDFTVFSFYKIFGFPDLGALIIRKDSGYLFRGRKYFGGGTVDVVLCAKEQWHAVKNNQLHENLEDGTLPIHNILALDFAISDYQRLYGTMDQVSRHVSFLSFTLFTRLSALYHGNSQPVCAIYSKGFNSLNHKQIQGPIIAFNLIAKDGSWVSNVEFERLASIHNFHIRTGTLCNPGGVAACLDLEPWELRRNFSEGFRCSTEVDIHAGKIFGVIRASVGAMSILRDIDAFISFIEEFFVDPTTDLISKTNLLKPTQIDFVVESLTIYPIKSCGGFKIPPDVDWTVRAEGLSWDREWCLIHQGTNLALSQKRYPRMVLLRPEINMKMGLLIVRYNGEIATQDIPNLVSVSLSGSTNGHSFIEETTPFKSRVCGETIIVNVYLDNKINQFFSTILGVPCQLARFPAEGSGICSRQSKAHLQKHQSLSKRSSSNQHDDSMNNFDPQSRIEKRPILLSNESPILLVNQASVSHLNNQIATTGGKLISASVFRPNIVVRPLHSLNQEPYAEDGWSKLKIGIQNYQILGACQRCHMICIDQNTAEKNNQPFTTLVKTRRFNSKVYFGCHVAHIPQKSQIVEKSLNRTMRVGDTVIVLE